MQTDNIISLISTIRDKSNKFLMERMHAEGVADIVPAHGSIIVRLFGGKELPMGEIARLIHRDKSTVTTLVNKLVKLGYAEKVKSLEDSRVNLVRLTEDGNMLEPAFMEISSQLLEKVWGGFTKKDREDTIAFLTRIRENM